MRPTPWRPIRELEEMRWWFDEDIARPFMRGVWERIPEEEKSWAPSIDTFEMDDSYVVKVELPGMKLEDIDVSVSDDALTVKGQKKPESGVKDEDYYRSEIAYGSFSRTITLPSTADTKNIEASYEDGMLRIRLPRTAEATPKKVTVSVKKGV